MNSSNFSKTQAQRARWACALGAFTAGEVESRRGTMR